MSHVKRSPSPRRRINMKKRRTKRNLIGILIIIGIITGVFIGIIFISL